MRKVAIVGAGQGGLYLGFALLARGYQVSLYSDKSASDMLNARLMSTAFQFEPTLKMERALGLAFWDGVVQKGEGAYLDFRDPTGAPALTVSGRLLEDTGMVVDQRTKYAKWIGEFERRGGKLTIRAVTRDDLEKIAGEHDVTFVAAGKGEIKSLFPRDEARSKHTTPPRKLTAVLLQGPNLLGPKPWKQADYCPLRFNFVAGVGEFFFSPFYTHAVGEARSIFFEAVPGGELDRFDDAKSANEVLAIARELVARFAPEDMHQMEGATVVDDTSYLIGSFTPEVRGPVGRLASGKVVMAIGDTYCLNDPIAGQGANAATRMSEFIANAIVEHGAAAFDSAWMQETADAFWEKTGKYATDISNMLLDTPPEHVGMTLGAASTDPALASAFVRCLADPVNFWPWIENMAGAQQFIAKNSSQQAA